MIQRTSLANGMTESLTCRHPLPDALGSLLALILAASTPVEVLPLTPPPPSLLLLMEPTETFF